MLRAGAQVICRWENHPGQFNCEAFNGLALLNPALITITHCGSSAARHSAREIRGALVRELEALGATAIMPPCGPNNRAPLTACHALGEQQCQKLLVIVGDDQQPFLDSPDLRLWRAGAPTFVTLPTLPEVARSAVGHLLPAWATPLNVVFWTASPRETVPAILAQSGMTAEVPKIFISYRQTESAALAIQLFDALGHAGFDVFLDHFRIPPGVNFQSRLTQELGDKSMVLFLESATFNNSQWVIYEVNVAKACGLGMHALNLCGAPKAPGVDEGLRTLLNDQDIVGGHYTPTAGLTPAALAGVLATVRTEHDRAIVKRRQILERALEGAVLSEGGNLPARCGSGCMRVDSLRPPGKRYVVALTPRPPDLPDFYRVHGQVVQPVKGVVVGLSRLMEPPRVERLTWLSGVSNLMLKDEGEMLDLARQLVRGTL
jgi:TIR domain